MRKTCAQPVDGLGNNHLPEYILYPQSFAVSLQHVANPTTFPTVIRTFSDLLSTAIFGRSNLLHTHLSTFYTGLITNITKETYLKTTL